jgi:hypothetical protein
MKLVLQRSGGFAAIPALSRDIVVDTGELPPDSASELERLVAAVRLENRPTPTGAADIRDYRLTVDDGRRSHVLDFSDLSPDLALHELVTRLEEIERGQ